MAEVTLNADLRETTGKKVGALRREEKIPGIFYQHGEPNISITVYEKNLLKLIHSTETHLINLKLENGNELKCIIRDYQLDPVSERPLHVDFQGIRADKKLTLEIPVVIVGHSPQGVKDGGMLQHITHKLKVSCFPKDIPEHIEINAENLLINQSIHVSDIVAENYTILDNASTTIVAILPPLVEKAPATLEETVEITEPEVVGKGKKAEEEEEESK